MNFSSLHKLRVLFVCENNMYACQTPLGERQPEREIVKLADAHMIKSYRSDGNDAVSVYDTAKKAVEYMRSSGMPAFVEFLTYRWLEHCGTNEDKNMGYRSETEINEWKSRCPIERLERTILDIKGPMREELKKIELKITQDIEEAVRYAKESPFPEKSTLYNYIYSE